MKWDKHLQPQAETNKVAHFYCEYANVSAERNKICLRQKPVKSHTFTLCCCLQLEPELVHGRPIMTTCTSRAQRFYYPTYFNQHTLSGEFINLVWGVPHQRQEGLACDISSHETMITGLGLRTLTSLYFRDSPLSCFQLRSGCSVSFLTTDKFCD